MSTPRRDESSPGDPRPDAGALSDVGAFDFVPRLLVALAGACTVSGVIGLTWIVVRESEPSTLVLLIPPALVLAATPFYVLRHRRMEER